MQSDPLVGKVVIVTGAGRGLGRVLALEFAKAGANVCVSSRKIDACNQVALEIEELGGRALPIQADITDESDVQSLISGTVSHFGRLDVLVNNAGAFDGGAIEEMSIETWEKVLATNLSGPFLCTREALRVMKSQKHGRIINIGSISAHRVRPHSAAYSASKFGLWGLSQVTALEGRAHGVTCCCIQPGNIGVERRLASSATEDAEPMMAMEDVAHVVLTAASLPAHVAMLEATVLPRDQMYVGRG
jgi:NAD(P)-dependent dehydrogenase (short-subunit alcohol dehydrogenase family)